MNEPAGLKLVLLPGLYSIVRLDPVGTIPEALLKESHAFCSITRTDNELSIVCPTSAVTPKGSAGYDGWRCIRVAGTLDLNLTGILSSLINPLAAAGVRVLSIGTYETDYLLVPEADLNRAVEALRAAGHRIDERQSH